MAGVGAGAGTAVEPHLTGGQNNGPDIRLAPGCSPPFAPPSHPSDQYCLYRQGARIDPNQDRREETAWSYSGRAKARAAGAGANGRLSTMVAQAGGALRAPASRGRDRQVQLSRGGAPSRPAGQHHHGRAALRLRDGLGGVFVTADTGADAQTIENWIYAA